jgi:hypothetical protein
VSYRDDHEAAIMRADAADRHSAQLVEANRRLERELAEAKMWLGGPRRRIAVLTGMSALCVAMLIGGVLLGQSTVDVPAPVERAVEPALPLVFGTIVADGPLVGRWTVNATRCVWRSDGIELTAAGSEDHVIWLTNNTVEVEVPGGDFVLERSQCHQRLGHEVRRSVGDPATFDGYVALDCTFNGNSLHGHVEFKNCR